MKKISLFELKKIQSEFPQIIIKSEDAAYEFIKQFFLDDLEIFESAFILLLNRANKTIGYAKISQGGISSTVIDVRLIAKYAVDSLASAVILAHNHPSGNIEPSQVDIQLTKKIKEGLNFLDIKLLDHLILGPSSYFSMNEQGIM